MKDVVVRKLSCKRCGGSGFTFTWRYSPKDENKLYLGHPGWGFELTDSIVRCVNCGTTSKYEEEDFLEAKEVKK